MKKSLKNILKLKQKKYKDKENKFILEGTRNVEEALKSGIQIYSVLYTQQLLNTKRGLDLYKNLEAKNIERIVVKNEELKSISHNVTPQGILAVCKRREYDFSKVIKSGIKSLVILDDIQDPGNIGTIIRTADAAGVSAVIVTKDTADIYNPKVLSASMGSILHIPVISVDNLQEILRILKTKGVRILACDIRGTKSYLKADYSYPVGLVFGNEGAGLDTKTIDLADEVIKIPIIGNAESLNVGITCGIVLYKMLETAGGEN